MSIQQQNIFLERLSLLLIEMSLLSLGCQSYGIHNIRSSIILLHFILLRLLMK
jgi:hypothetical protein